jgi:O-antigen/teichoic acid export membrane protein
MFRSVFIGHEQFKLEALVVLIERVILLTLGVIVLVMELGLIPFAIVFMVSGFISLIIVIAFYIHYIGNIKIVWELSYVKKLVKESLPFGMTAAAFMIYFRVDTVMLSLLKNDAEVGWYNAAYRLIEGLIVIPTILYYVLFPRLSVLHEEARESVLRLSQMACKYTIAVALLIVFLGMITAEKLILLIYGMEYINSVSSWRILLAGVTFMFLWSVFVVILNSTNRPHIPLIGVGVGSATNIILNLFLIPKFGYIGTSVSTVVSEIVLFCYLLIALSRNGFKLKLIENAVKPMLASAASMGIIFLFLKGNEVMAVLIGAIGYFAALYIFGFFNEEEKKLLRSLKASLINSLHNNN